MKNLKVVIPAGGDGTRLGKITEGEPKTFLLFKRKPLLNCQLEILKDLGLKDILLSFNNKQQIQKFKKFIKDKKVPQNINYSFGIHSAFDHPGKLFLSSKVRSYIKDSDFLFSQGDLVFEEELIIKLFNAYKKHRCFITNSGKPKKGDKIEFLKENNFVMGARVVECGKTTWRYGGLFIVPKEYHQMWLDTFLSQKESLTPVFFSKCLENNKKIFVVEYEGTFINVNTEKDYKLAQKYLNSKH